MDSPWRDEGRLRRLYHDEGLNMHEMADELGCDYRTIHRWMSKFDIETQTAWQDQDGPWRDKETLYELYVEQGLSTLQIADKFECDGKTILNWLNRHDIPTRPSTHDIDRGWRDPGLMHKLYVGLEMTDAKIAEELNTKEGTITKWRNRHGIEARDNSGENSHLWRGGDRERYYGANWREQRRRARRRDQHRCQDCGATRAEFDHALHVHHIRPFNEFDDYEQANRLENLVTLCDSCHTKWEHELNNIHG